MSLKPEFEQLLTGYLNDTLSRAEFDLFFAHLELEKDEDIKDYLHNLGFDADTFVPEKLSEKGEKLLEQRLNKIWLGLPNADTSEESAMVDFRSRNFMYLKIAAAVFIALSFTAYLFFFTPNIPDTPQIALQDIYPSDNISQITLPNGKLVTIPDSVEGVLYTDEEVEIIRQQDGELQFVYRQEPVAEQIDKYNSIQTSKGGFTKFELADGTKVFLNSQSTLRFPLQFRNGQRTVYLTGEGYFEVAKNAETPFRVYTGKQVVEVLGTMFNVRSYEDEDTETTTLLEGRVKVKALGISEEHEVLLSPGKQSSLSSGRITVSDVVTENFIGWVNKRFVFKGVPLRGILHDIELWYDVEFVVDQPLPDVRIVGNLSKDVALDKLLEVLSLNMGCKFSILGRRIYMKK